MNRDNILRNNDFVLERRNVIMTTIESIQNILKRMNKKQKKIVYFFYFISLPSLSALSPFRIYLFTP